MRADVEALDAWLGEHDLREAVAELAPKPLILLHARGDAQVPSTWSEELYRPTGDPAPDPGRAGRASPLRPARSRAAGDRAEWLARQLGRG